MAQMDLNEILSTLMADNAFFSRKAVRELMRRREEITPILLEMLRDTKERAEELAGNDTETSFFLRLYGIHLLAQSREPRAYPALVELLRLDEELLNELFVDFVGEELPAVLASLCNGDTSLIEALIEDPIGIGGRSGRRRSHVSGAGGGWRQDARRSHGVFQGPVRGPP